MPGLGSLDEKLGELRKFAASRLTEFRKLLPKPANVHKAPALLAQQFGKFTLSPVSDSSQWNYKTGSVDLFGEKLVRMDKVN